MRNAGLEETQAGIKIAGRNINADDTTLNAESEEELKSLLMKVKVESEKVGLKLNIQYHASNLDWPFISYMILNMFQCHSPKSSHPHPLPQNSKDCSIYKRLF